MSSTPVLPGMVRTVPWTRCLSNRPLPQLSCHLTARANLLPAVGPTGKTIWQDKKDAVVVRLLSIQENAMQEALAMEDVVGFKAKLESLSTSKHVSAAETEEAQFHLNVAENNLGTAPWRGGVTVLFCVVRESTMHTAHVSLLVEKPQFLGNSIVSYTVEESSGYIPRMAVMNSVAYLTARERYKPMNASDAVRAVRRYAIAHDEEVSGGGLEKITTATALKTAFFNALNDEQAKHILETTCDISSACVVVTYTPDSVSASAVDELLASAEHLCGNVAKGLHPVHKCKSTCSFYCSLTAVHTTLYQTRGLVAGGRFTAQVLGILRILERRMVYGDLARPERTDVVTQPKIATLRTLAKILADVFGAIREAQGGAETGFDEVAEYLGNNLTLVPAGEIIGSAARQILKQLSLAWTLRRECSGPAQLFACYDRLRLEESLECVVCNSTVRTKALEVRCWRITFCYRAIHSQRVELNNVLQHLNELDVDSSNYDSMAGNWKSLAMKVMSSFKDAIKDMAVKCGRMYGVFDQADKIRLSKCEERFNNFSRFVPRPVVHPTSPADANVESDPGAGAVNKTSNSYGKKRVGGRHTNPVESVKKKARSKTKARPTNVAVSDNVYKGRASASRGGSKSNTTAEGDEVPALPLQRRRFNMAGGAPSASIAVSSAHPKSTPSRIRNTRADGGAVSAASNEPSAKAIMRSNVDGLAINPGNRDPLKGAVWVTEPGAQIDEGRKCEQYRERQRRLPPCIAHASYGDVQGNVAPYLLTPSEIDVIGEHARRLFLDCRNMVKSTCRWSVSHVDAVVVNDVASAYHVPGEVRRRFELFGTGATVFEDALLPRSANGDVIHDSKPFYADFIPAVDKKVVCGLGTIWEYIINSPEDGPDGNDTRFGRAMTLPNAVNKLGEAEGSRSGQNPTHLAYASKGEGDCMLASVISRLFEHDVVGNPDSTKLQMSYWGTKMLASISPDWKYALGPMCRCNVHLGCPAQRQHVDLPLVTSGTEMLPPGTCAKDSEIGIFTIITGEHGATIRIIRGGMNFMNAPEKTFESAVHDCKFSQLYIKPYSIAAMRSDLPHAGDEYIMSMLRLSMEGDEWAAGVIQLISKLMSNKCGCKAGDNATICECDGTCAPLAHVVVKQKDLIRGHCYFSNKDAVNPLTNAVYSRGVHSGFGVEEEGGVMQAELSKLTENWV